MNSPSSSQDDRLIDFKETAHLLGDISERSVRRLIASGELPQPVKVLSAPRLYHSEIKAYLERLKNMRPPGNARFYAPRLKVVSRERLH